MREKTRLAIMFADIAGSTKLYELFGDAKAREVTSRCIELLTAITEVHQGKVVKTIGDEVMCTFNSADEAAEAAIQMQEDVTNNAEALGTPLQIRVGFHFGEVIREMERQRVDVFGDAVNTAARMAAQAKADQIITTGETLGLLDPDIAEDSRPVITTTVKGKAKPLEIFEITWGEEDDLTVMGGMPSAMASEPKIEKMMVSNGASNIEMGPSNANLTLGRGKQSDLRVLDNMASRLHCRLEFKRDRFVVIDQSTNGTYVITEQGEVFHVHRDEHQLIGKGVIGLGQKVGPGDAMAVAFEVME
ncbi:adenylate/guanylate cyclase domain-containing protein [Magnetococcus sp. PR-3]|uniref:adenylate/guanylate cyclase domain-containing protein n=1 Tax=Magnetococcus sp. PR-3 TaxID=3120355 RepID=UPI002FCE1FF3